MTSRVDYDRVAPGYDRRYTDNAYPGICAYLDAFAAPGQRVVEVGCGTGHWVARFRATGCHTLGVDPSRGMLEQARERLGDGLFVRARGEALPLASGSVDRLLVVNALHHFDEPARFAHEAHRVLVEGGRVVVFGLDPSQGRDRWYVYDYFERTLELDRARYPSTRQIAGWLEAAGFTETESQVGEHLAKREPAESYLKSGALTKTWTSQLTLLTDAEFDAGVAAMEAAVERARARGEVLELHADLHIYATSARR